MRLLYRRLIFYVLVLIFLIGAPALAAYTSGYRWNSKQYRVVKTGALSVESNPSDAAIIINGATYAHTPALITKLLPGQYEIALEKEGFFSWKKNLLISSGQTTFAHEVALFKKSGPKIIDHNSPPPPLNLRGGADNNPPLKIRGGVGGVMKMYYDSKRDIIVVVDNDAQRRIAELPGNRALWSVEDSLLLFTYSANEVWQFDPKTQTATLITRLSQNIQEVLLIPRLNALIIVLDDRIRALELDLRDQQNSWDLAEFENIKTAWLSENNRTLFIDGAREDKSGLWELELL